MKKVLAISAAMVQIAAVLLLQWHSFAPHLSRRLLKPPCRGDHVECGCSQEKIASRTCCCFRYKAACGDMHPEEHVSVNGKGSTSRYLSVAPCGGSPRFIGVSLDKLKIVPPGSILPSPPGYVLSYNRPAPEKASTLFTEPPDPPPRILLHD